MNVNTGKLDLSKFSQSLSRAGQTLQGMYTSLSAIGPQGEKAFLALSTSISQADQSALTLGARFNELLVSLKNTARWQISSSILHGFMSSISSAYRYAEDLNESLNNIRIVTNASVDEMDRFAVKANEAARALNTTTTEYTNAALIFYQQGLSDSEVEERTNATIKLANVSRQSAQEVSDEMTAVWNNFDDGSKSLEYYIDVMAKLGAATASSTQEISAGLEKFAAVADTVGLSYEYATAALATVTATTRQSADVVGTAFKTLFARLQDLELGETLDDGTSLGKYSAALNTVGVNIMDINNEVKDMDTILDELGAKWDTIAKDEQIALAQTVAGTRQYTQLLALLDNWDFMQENLNTVSISEGELDRQAEVYAQSWEAARDRVRAAWEDVWGKLVNDEGFISLLNVIEDVINGISNMIDGLGGLKGILNTIAMLVMQRYAKEIPGMLQYIGQQFDIITGKAEKNRQQMLNENSELVKSLEQNVTGYANKAQLAGLAEESRLRAEMAAKNNILSESEKRVYEAKIENLRISTQFAQSLGGEIDKIDQETRALERQAQINLARQGNLWSTSVTDEMTGQAVADRQAAEAAREQAIQKQAAARSVMDSNAVGSEIYKQAKTEYDQASKQIDTLKNKITDLQETERRYSLVAGQNGRTLIDNYKKSAENLGLVDEVLNTVATKADFWKTSLDAAQGNEAAIKSITQELLVYVEQLQTAGVDVAEIAEQIRTAGNDTEKIQLAINALDSVGSSPALDNLRNQVSDYRNQLIALGVEESTLDKLEGNWQAKAGAVQQYTAALHQTEQQTRNLGNETVKLSAVIGQMGSIVMSLSMALNGLVRLKDIWTDEDLSTGQKLIQTFGALAQIIPAVTGLITANTIVTNALTKANIALNGVFAASPLLTIYLGLAALVGVIYLVVKAVQALSDAWHAEEIALEKAKEDAVAAQDAFENATNAYNKLKDTIKDYDDSLSAIHMLTEGTTEFQDAVSDANERARELIDTYDFLKDKYSYNANTGLIEFDDGALEAAEKQQKQILDSTKIAYNIAQNSKDQAEIIANNKQFKQNNETVELIDEFGNKITAPVQNQPNYMPALEQLQKTFVETGNFAKSLDSLDDAQRELIDTLIQGGVDVEGLCEAVKENTNAILQRNKENVDTILAGNEAYETSADKDLTNTIISQYLSNEAQRLYDEDYANRSMNVVGVDFAKSLGLTYSGSKDGMGTYYREDENGEQVEVKYTDDFAKMTMAQQAASDVLKNNAVIVDELVEKSNTLYQIRSAEAAGVETLADFEAARQRVLEQAKKDGLTEEQANDFIMGNEKFAKMSYQYNLSNLLGDMLLSKNTYLSEDQIAAFKDNISNAIQEITNSMSEEDLKLAVSVAGDTESIDEFARVFEQKITEASLDSYENTVETLENTMKYATEEGKFQDSDLEALRSNNDFNNYLETFRGMDYDIFRSEDYQEQYALISDFYSFIRNNMNETYEYQKQLYQQEYTDRAELYAQIKQLEQEASNLSVNDIARDEIEQQIQELKELSMEQFGIDISLLNPNELQSELDTLQDKINDITDQQYKLDISWDNVDSVEGQLKQIGEFAHMMKKEAKLVGDQYHISAQQMREWADVYPDLFAQAKSAGKGIMTLDKQVVDNYIDTQDARIDSSIEVEIETLEARKATLEADLELAKADLEAAQAVAEGRIDYDKLSAESIADLRQQLVEYFIQNGVDETEANKLALETMGLNEDQYTQKVAEATERNATNHINSEQESSAATENAVSSEVQNYGDLAQTVSNVSAANAKNQADAAEDGATAQASVLKKLSERFNTFINGLKKVAAAVKNALSGNDVSGSVDDLSGQIFAERGKWSSGRGGGFSGAQIVTPTNKYDYQLKHDYSGQLDPATLEQLQKGDVKAKEFVLNDVGDQVASNAQARLNLVQTALDNVVAQIAYLKGLKAQELEDYGSDISDLEPDGKKKKGSSKKGDDDKARKKIIEDLEKYQERYHEILRDIQFHETLLKRIQKEHERAFGVRSRKLIENEIKEIETLIDRNETLYNAQQGMLALDRVNVLETFSNATFDEVGNISNYTQLLLEATDQYNAVLKEYEEIANKEKVTDEEKYAAEEKKDAAEKEYEKKKEILEQYEDTFDQLLETEDAIADYEDQIEDLNFEDFTTAVQGYQTVNDNLTKYLTKSMDILQDTIWKAAEAMQFVFSANRGGTLFTTYRDEFPQLKSSWEELTNLYDKGAISQANFIEGLETLRDRAYSMVDGLQDVNEQMRAYYEDVLSKATEKLTQFTDVMEHQVSILEHMNSLLNLTGRKKDFEALLDVSNAQVQLAKNAYEVSKANFDSLKKQVEDARATEQELIASGLSDEALEEWRDDVLWPAVEAMNEAEEQMYTDAEEWMNKAAENFDLKMQEASQKVEDLMTNGLGWDYLSDSMARAQSVQDEYLTKTNQIYETNDLLRKLAKDAEKTDSVAAKTKLKNFANEITALQQQEKLNKSDLDIAKARYELLLAEIALEDAQNAKTTVRLQRDNEGNYGYVYTADQDQVDNAESDYAKKQNDLYNLVLSQANDYSQKIIQTEQEMYAALDELARQYQDGTITSEEEYQQKKQEIIDHYNDLLTAQRHSYYTAIGWLDKVAATDHDEAWTSSYADVIEAGADWKDTTENYIKDIDDAVKENQEIVQEATHEESLGLEDVKKRTDELRNANEQLKDTTINSLIPALEKEMDAAQELTEEWVRQYDTIMDLIDQYMQLIQVMNAAYAAQARGFGNVDYSWLKTQHVIESGYDESSINDYLSQQYNDWRTEKGKDPQYSQWLKDIPTSDLDALFASAAKGNQAARDLMESVSRGDEGYSSEKIKKALQGYATGGYTGAWGSEGKIGILHEKELVLNQSDTQNLLDAISIVRDFTRAIDLRSSAFGFTSLLSPQAQNMFDQVLQQQVTITAEFPNVNDRYEIESAINSLVNRASQYVARV